MLGQGYWQEKSTKVNRFEIYFRNKINGVLWKLDFGWHLSMWHIGVCLEKVDVCWPLSEKGNNYEEIILEEKNQECSNIPSNFDEMPMRQLSQQLELGCDIKAGNINVWYISI